MPRQDLIALTEADLESLTNRGTVKRAQREVDAAGAQVEIDETPAGDVAFQWPDGIACSIPAGKTLRDGRCSCAATSLCRHLIQSVLVYQKRQAAQSTEAPPVHGPWNPGAVDDAELEKHFPRGKLTAVRNRLQQGILVELVRSAKPWARFEDDQCTLRFLVPNDVRYVTCDCAEPAPCPHVALAVWAFRALPPDKDAGMVPLGWHDPEPPLALLDDIEALLAEATRYGIAGLNKSWRDRLARLEERTRAGGLVWPAEVLADLLLLFDAYHAHDARFSPEVFSQHIGELLIRMDAIRARTTAVPQVWVRGSKADRPTELATSRLIGLGCEVIHERRSVRLLVYLQDSDTGSLTAVEKEVPDPPEGSTDPVRSFRQLARLSVAGSISIEKLAEGQLLVRGAKRLPSHRLILPRGQKGQVNPQGFAWEKLRAPLLAEDFAEVRAHLASMPPASLRPRRVTENLQVCAIARVEGAVFNPITQCVEAMLVDARGEQAWLRHPFTSRGQEGTEGLLRVLTTPDAPARFVAGHVSLSGRGLVIAPTSVVTESAAGRRGYAPWIGGEDQSHTTLPANPFSMSCNLVTQFHHQVRENLGATLLSGIERTDASIVRAWQDTTQLAERIGLLRFRDHLADWMSFLDARNRRLDWNADDAVRRLHVLLALAKLGEDLQA